MTGIRRALAAWLDPETSREAAMHRFTTIRMREASSWIGSEFPVVHATLRWIRCAELHHFASTDDLAEPGRLPEHVPGKPWIHRIGDVRDHLRAEFGE